MRDARIEMIEVTFFLPAHPSYFGEEWNQEEIDAAIAEYAKSSGGSLPAAKQDRFIFVREPGKFTGPSYSTQELSQKIRNDKSKMEQFDGFQTKGFIIHVNNIKQFLQSNRAKKHGR